MHTDPLQAAISRAGSTAKLAAALGIASQAISQWRRVPAGRVLDVERVTGVSRHDLRPDLYPRDAASQDAAA
jgi:DNA-binding transcriptional regulator YdaS (Cro superfamily)